MFQTEQTATEALAAEVRASLARRSMRANELSSRTSIAPSTLSRKLNGKADFSFIELWRIANVLGVRVSDLVGAALDTVDEPAEAV